MSQVGDILRTLADLVPATRSSVAETVDITSGGAPVVELGISGQDLFRPAEPPTLGVPDEPPALRVASSAPLQHLQGIGALHQEERILRAGWIFLCGRADVDGRPRRICLPLFARPVTLQAAAVARHQAHAVPGKWLDVVAIGDALGPPGWPADAPLWDTDLQAGVFTEVINAIPDFRDAVAEAGRAAGFGPVTVAGPELTLEAARRADHLQVVVTGAVYVERDRDRNDSARSQLLRAWAEVPGLDATALAEVYGVAAEVEPAALADGEVPQPLPLTAAQREVVERARVEPVTVVSGPPGNGKSHAVCAVAIDAVARGLSVLVATPTPFAADVLGDLLDRQPGPEAVRFGAGGGRRGMISALEALTQSTVGDGELDRRWKAGARAAASRREAEAVVLAALEREVRAERASRWTPRLSELRAAAPGVFAPGADLAEVQHRVAAALERASWWRKRRLRALVDSAPIVGVAAIADAVEAASDVRAELELDRLGGTSIGAAWDALLTAEAAQLAAEGEIVDGLVRAEKRWGRKGRRAVSALLRALPAGRATRRQLLADIDAAAMVRALPLWIGTLSDVEELLPARPGLFDLVIVDEATQVDQSRAAGALLRAKRAVIVGDPRQLRHVSFVADAAVRDAQEDHGVGELADRLDVRRQSLFDVAVGAGPVTFLDEHFRSVPHLIDFSSQRFYDGRIRIATRHPVNESDDVIDVVHVPDLDAEVSATVEAMAARVAAGDVGIGAYSPFRAHADAIELAVLERFPAGVIVDHGLRTGTAHSAQGSERDVVIVALGLRPDDPAMRWRFAEDPNLFNVLVTRARRHLTMVTCLPVGGTGKGLIADYLRHAEAPPLGPAGTPAAEPWVAELAAELARNGVSVRPNYPVGRWQVDICAETPAGVVALDCAVHPDGPAAHLGRHRALRRAGWRVVDAFASLWDGDAARAAVDLAGALADGGGGGDGDGGFGSAPERASGPA